MVDDLEIPIVVEMKRKVEHFQYRMISPVTIIRANKGPLNLQEKTTIGQRHSKISVKIANQRIIEAYLTQMGMDGWELVTDLSYEALPYNGALVFKKRYYVDDETPEETTIIADHDKNLNEGNLYQEFEKESSKKAVWQGKETKAYRAWLEAKNTPKSE